MTLEIKNVDKTFNGTKVVENLSMSVRPGEVMGLIGQNGAGKTTTFRMILKFISTDSGTITWNGANITQNTKKNIGFLPEERGLYQKMTIENQIMYFAELHGMKRSDIRIRLIEWMKRLEVIGDPMDKVETLSKGNAQKVQFIATMIHEPEILILDEPFTGLDPVNTAILRDEINRMRKNGAAIIFSNHNMRDVELLSQNVTMLKSGKTVLQGGVQRIREGFGKINVYLESPISDSELFMINGVESIESQATGRILHLNNEEAGHEIFKKVSAKGYVQAFMQSPPSLEEIFRKEVENG